MELELGNEASAGVAGMRGYKALAWMVTRG